MRSRSAVVLFSLLFATPLFAKDVYLSIGGSVGVFRTDARILNPSFDKDITIVARYLPAGNADNSAIGSTTITVPKRAMAVYDDVVNSLFGGGPALGAVRLTSDDDFVATQRIYADKTTDHQGGTLGQFVPGLDVTTALNKGVLIQLKSGTTGPNQFRTNWGAVNPNATAATLHLKLYDKTNAVVGDAVTINVQPFGVIAPQNVAGTFGNPAVDLSDAWISYDSDQPLFLYASMLDNGSEDPTFIPASNDSGVPPTPPPPEPITVSVTAVDWNFTVTPSKPLHAGDQVTFIIRAAQHTHGFALFGPSGQQLIAEDPITADAIERTITLPASGTYTYFCTHSSCGSGHTGMNGTFDVGTPTNPDPPDGY